MLPTKKKLLTTSDSRGQKYLERCYCIWIVAEPGQLTLLYVNIKSIKSLNVRILSPSATSGLDPLHLYLFKHVRLRWPWLLPSEGWKTKPSRVLKGWSLWHFGCNSCKLSRGSKCRQIFYSNPPVSFLCGKSKILKFKFSKQVFKA